jgi:hypothetical protein
LALSQHDEIFNESIHLPMSKRSKNSNMSYLEIIEMEIESIEATKFIDTFNLFYSAHDIIKTLERVEAPHSDTEEISHIQ